MIIHWNTGYGTLRVYNRWAIVECGHILAKYYCSLHNKQYPYKMRIDPPLNGAHISVIRRKEEISFQPELKHDLDGMKVSFLYSTKIETQGVHYWMPVICPLLDDVRLLFGCGPKLVEYHLSIGNHVAELNRTEKWIHKYAN